MDKKLASQLDMGLNPDKMKEHASHLWSNFFVISLLGVCLTRSFLDDMAKNDPTVKWIALLLVISHASHLRLLYLVCSLPVFVFLFLFCVPFLFSILGV
jgi:hypothetical protein